MYYFIINPASGSGRGRAVWSAVESELNRLGTDYRSYLLSKSGDAKALAASLSTCHFPVTLVVVGGDGTINEVINGLTSFENITFACIPTGSGNDFVRGLKLLKDPIQALHAILSPKKIAKINLGSLVCSQKGRFSYAVSAGIGYDAAVCNSVLNSRIKTLLNHFHFGKLVYLLTALRQLFTMKRRTLTITIDGLHPQASALPGAPKLPAAQKSFTYRCENTYFAAAMNLRYEGGGFMFAPDALYDDDYLDLIVVHGLPRLKILFLLPTAFFGKHVVFHGIDIIRCQKASVNVSQPMCIHTDGEIPGFSKSITMALHPEKLSVIIR